jgi:endonuclease/exonuclease/phosphatase family metal-dependent hydrolase
MHNRQYSVSIACLMIVAMLAGLCSGNHLHAQSLKVMTYNIHHANPPSHEKDSLIDLAAIVRVIDSVKPDLVALQELDVNNARSGANVNEAQVLAEKTNMHFYFAQAIAFRGGGYGVAVLSRWPILDTMHVVLPMAPGVPGETRALAVIKVKTPAGKTLLFASTHLDQHRAAESRLLQAHTIAQAVKMFKYPVILCGDMNDYPESETLKVLDSVLTRSCKGSGCPLTIPVNPPRRTIDYILFNPAARFEAISVKTVAETYASDHLPVVAELRMK